MGQAGSAGERVTAREMVWGGRGSCRAFFLAPQKPRPPQRTFWPDGLVPELDPRADAIGPERRVSEGERRARGAAGRAEPGDLRRVDHPVDLVARPRHLAPV